MLHDEELFATDEVHCHGQLIGLVLAHTKKAAIEGARAVVVKYMDLPAVLTIQEAVRVIKRHFSLRLRLS